jgi:hypothetical protein
MRLLGKYRGIVTDNHDPHGQGRLRARLVDVLREKELGWALPCVAYAGKDLGLYLVPPTGAHVWVEFEQGDIEFPVWTGCYWEIGETPEQPAVPENKVLKTDSFTIKIEDLLGTLTVTNSGGMKLTMTPLNIEITTGQGATVKLTAMQTSINDGALEVT